MFDVVVIGSGPGGYVAAIRAAQLGLKTALVEKEKTLGGTCLNVGCIPSKALLQSSELWEKAHLHGKEHGFSMEGASLDFPQMMKRKEKVVESLVGGIAGLIQKNRIERIEGRARFLSRDEIEAGGRKIRSKHFIVATGSFPIELPFLSFDEERVVSSTGALSLKKIPEKLAVIGAGVIGVELASVYRRLGSEVSIVEMLPEICPAMDGELSRQLRRSLERQGINFLLKAGVKEASLKESQVILRYESEGEESELRADVVLVAVGRKPYTEGLCLEEAGVSVDSKGFIPVDGSFRTETPHLFAIGDVIQGPMLAHRASEEGLAVAELIAGKSASIDYMTIPLVIYTHPEAASVGMSEEEANRAGLELLIGTSSLRGNPRARCSGEAEGLVKILAEKESERLIGLHILGAQGSEMIHEGVIALKKRALLSEIAEACHAHPTLSEAIKEAALAAYGRAIHA